MEIKEIKNFLRVVLNGFGFGMLGLIVSIQLFSPVTREVSRNFSKVKITFKSDPQPQTFEFVVSRGGQHRKQLQNRILKENEGVIYLIFPPKRVLIESEMISEPIDFLALNRQGRILEIKTVMHCQKDQICTTERMKERAYYIVALKGGTAARMGFQPGRVLPLPQVLPLPDYEKEVERAAQRLQQQLPE